MEKINEIRCANERGGSVPLALLGVALAVNLFNIGFQTGKAVEHSDKSIADIQRYNGQVATQLAETTNSPITQLTLDEEDHFSFQTTATDGNNETCSGEYAVKQAMAVISGKITCKEITTLTPSN